MKSCHIHQKTPFSHANLKKKRSLLPKNTLPLPLKPLRLINHPVTLQNSILRPGNITQSHKQPPINLLIIYNSNHNFPQPAIPVRHIYPPSHQPHKPERPHKYDKLSHLPSFPKILIHKTSQYSTIHAICLLSQAKNKKIYQPSIQATAKRLAVPLPPYRHNLPHPNTAEYNHKSTTSRHHNQELL